MIILREDEEMSRWEMVVATTVIYIVGTGVISWRGVNTICKNLKTC
ncbi:hypothetical protein AGMMS5026_10740 [Endomicrobiia bacterium]|nr:hypothetical protein AGMMS49523_10920 [Endomicrobiia bacterium]GHT14678.1 hypothetical protein AGMMS49571_10790 [Endomicrobiia bacterium]GHT18628.1 hypothetical protein AGMMS49929_00650 [Endomicrobiia bacterium]GHT28930.1 hypothetical protein AGMMS49995_10570 [Endomicrobiia bacterium]GHT32553.1 hypothetical protein AGMMS5026_10740 [Endomicrobiia bacterium]